MTTTWQKDIRTGSFSFLTEMKISTYLDLAEAAYGDRGGVDGQRDPLKTTTARRIRSRMIEDLAMGAILPPIVLGVTLEKESFDKLPLETDADILEFLSTSEKAKIAIIDGMQRTTALKEASVTHPVVLERSVRVEFWLAESVHSLVYRMLVLNTGQVPWTLSRQLEVVYSSLISDIEKNVSKIKRVIREDEAGRRVKAAEYKSSILVELYLSFSSRKSNIDTKQAVSAQFAQLDFVENLSQPQFQEQFYFALNYLSSFDEAFANFSPTNTDVPNRFKTGRHIFDASAARIGFIVAFGQYIIGRTGADRLPDEQEERAKHLKAHLDKQLAFINSLKGPDLENFLQLDVLQQLLEVKSGKVGEFERQFFEKAFAVLFESSPNVKTMETCWRAY